ncbi:MAG: TrmH family RNA methyltransferase [Planctomycetota bacterium]|nr:MAG: TrmH family RNA methyltransferase [Planctomycetota bacterium]
MPEHEAPRRLRRAEAVLRRRSRRILLVVEACASDHNFQAVLRTAEGFGVQHVWLVDDPLDPRTTRRGISNAVTKGTHRWLSLRRFPDTAACLRALSEEGRELWASQLAADAEQLLPGRVPPIPPRLALAVGSEARGVSPELLAAARRRVCLPMWGFTDSFNLSVATGLLLQRLFDACPEAHGDLDEAERAELRRRWYERLARSERQFHAWRRWLEEPPEPLPDPRPPDALRRPRMKKSLLQQYVRRSLRLEEEEPPDDRG